MSLKTHQTTSKSLLKRTDNFLFLLADFWLKNHAHDGENAFKHSLEKLRKTAENDTNFAKKTHTRQIFSGCLVSQKRTPVFKD